MLTDKNKAAKVTISEIKKSLKGLKYYSIERVTNDRMNNVVIHIGDFDTQYEFENYKRKLKKKLNKYDYIIDDEDVIIWRKK
jgi:hypothetical protein